MTASARVTSSFVTLSIPEQHCDAGIRGARPHRVRRAGLGNPAFAHHRDCVAEGERLGHVMGDVDDGQAKLVEQLCEVGL